MDGPGTQASRSVLSELAMISCVVSRVGRGQQDGMRKG